MQDWMLPRLSMDDNDPCIVVIVVAIHCIFARNTRARSGLLSRFQVESPMIPSNFLVVPMISE